MEIKGKERPTKTPTRPKGSESLSSEFPWAKCLTDKTSGEVRLIYTTSIYTKIFSFLFSLMNETAQFSDVSLTASFLTNDFINDVQIRAQRTKREKVIIIFEIRQKKTTLILKSFLPRMDSRIILQEKEKASFSIQTLTRKLRI